MAQGYVRFFEPDVYVEAEKGLLEQVGLNAIREPYTIDPHIITLKELLKPEGKRSWSEPAFGLNISDVLKHIYRTERRFVLRDEREAKLVRPEPHSLVSEVLFGVHPTQKHASYISRNYKKAFKAEELEANPKTWLRVFRKAAETPLGITNFDLDVQRYWHHDPVVFVFDPRGKTAFGSRWIFHRSITSVPRRFFRTQQFNVLIQSRIVLRKHPSFTSDDNAVSQTNMRPRNIERIKRKNGREFLRTVRRKLNHICKTMMATAIPAREWRRESFNGNGAFFLFFLRDGY